MATGSGRASVSPSGSGGLFEIVEIGLSLAAALGSTLLRTCSALAPLEIALAIPAIALPLPVALLTWILMLLDLPFTTLSLISHHSS